LIGGEKPSPKAESSTDPTMAEVMAAFLEHAKIYYQQPDGKPGREYEMIRDTLRFVKADCSALPAKDFGPKRLKEIREAMIAKDHSRRYINKNIERIRRMIRWAVEEELVSPSVHTALSTVRGLKKGRTEARETDPITPVADSDVQAAVKHLPMIVADMVRLQRITGMRAGELVQMKLCDIDRTADVWVYRPPRHKTASQGKDRTVPLGPKAQAVLIPYLARGEDMHLFRPVDSEAKRQAEREAARKTPKSCGNRRGSNRVECPKRTAGEFYTVDAYRRAIARACERAKINTWSPHQLRHSRATEVRKEFGLEDAQIVLGHANADITQVYALRDLSRGIEIARLSG
jgi:integrase